MATGPEHYRLAESSLEDAWNFHNSESGTEREMYYLGQAQVHATLALAAATALFLPLDAANERRPEDEDAWHKVAGTYVDTSRQQA